MNSAKAGTRDKDKVSLSQRRRRRGNSLMFEDYNKVKGSRDEELKRTSKTSKNAE